MPESLFLIKLQAQAWNFMKKENVAQVVSCESREISKNTFFTEHLRRSASESHKNASKRLIGKGVHLFSKPNYYCFGRATL